MIRRRFLGLIVSFMCLSGATTTPAQARGGLRGGNMGEFVKRQAEKQRAKKEKLAHLIHVGPCEGLAGVV